MSQKMPKVIINMNIKGDNLPKNLYIKDLSRGRNEILFNMSGLRFYPSMVDPTIAKDILSDEGKGQQSESGEIYMYPSIPLNNLLEKYTNTDPKHVLNSKYWWKVFLDKIKPTLKPVPSNKLKSIVENNLEYILNLYLQKGNIISLKLIKPGSEDNKTALQNIIGRKYFRIDSIKWDKYSTQESKRLKEKTKLDILKIDYNKALDEKKTHDINNKDNTKTYNTIIKIYNNIFETYNEINNKLITEINQYLNFTIDDIFKQEWVPPKAPRSQKGQFKKKDINIKIAEAIEELKSISESDRDKAKISYDLINDLIKKLNSFKDELKNFYKQIYLPPYLNKGEITSKVTVEMLEAAILNIPNYKLFLKSDSMPSSRDSIISTYLELIKQNYLPSKDFKEIKDDYYKQHQILDSYQGGWMISDKFLENNYFPIPSMYAISVEIYITAISNLEQSLITNSLLNCSERASTIDRGLTEILGYDFNGFQSLLNNLPIRKKFLYDISTYVPPLFTDKFTEPYNTDRLKRVQTYKKKNEAVDKETRQYLTAANRELVRTRSQLANRNSETPFDILTSHGGSKTRKKGKKKRPKNVTFGKKSLKNLSLIIKDLYG